MEERLYLLQRHLPELLHLDSLIRLGERHLRVSEVLRVPQGDLALPVRVIEMGSRSPCGGGTSCAPPFRARGQRAAPRGWRSA